MAKITVHFASALYEPFYGYVGASSLRRDAFIEGVLDTELRRLDQAMDGKEPLSDKARRYVAKSLRDWSKKAHAKRPNRPGAKTQGAMVLVNMVVGDEIAERLDHRIEASRICRDAFFNRLLLFLVGSPSVLKHITLPAADDEEQSTIDLQDRPVPISPMGAIRNLMRDPLGDLHDLARRHWKRSLWEVPFPVEWHGMSCWIEPHNVPGTRDARELEKAVERLMRDPESLVKDLENVLRTNNSQGTEGVRS